MSRFSIADLHAIKEKNKAEFSLREDGYRAKVVVHMGTCGVASGAMNIMDVLTDEIRDKQLKNIIVVPAGCAGLCAHEPMVTIETASHPPVKYIKLDEEKMRELIKEHIMGNRPVEKYAMVSGGEATY